ncbi:MAG: multicopper oxidase domain-containing protein [Anaeromyxobacter sp.]|nr:multicopper oxidase domain-containing protein [Anaeromyxobacter sp.]
MADQTNYPYPGQCVADPLLPWGVESCALRPLASTSFDCPVPGVANYTAGGWRACGAVVPYTAVAPLISDSTAAAAIPTPKYQWEVLNPVDYWPDTTTFPGADYYEIGLHEAKGFQAIAAAGLFPNPLLAGSCPTATGQAFCKVTTPATPVPAACTAFNPAAVCTSVGAPAVPDGMQWTGAICTNPLGCSCPAELAAGFQATYCSAAGKIPAGRPVYTPIWGVGQIRSPLGVGGTVTAVLDRLLGTCSNSVPAGNLCWVGNALPTLPACTGVCTPLGLVTAFNTSVASPWSANDYVATWPSISIRATKGRPVVVRYVNEFTNNHIFCPHPDAADWPCAIDRTFMGVKAKVDPAIGVSFPAISTDGVNKYGSPQQPDNSWVTHLHGGDIPPSTDGFAMKWFGNRITGPLYSPNATHISPHFDGPPSAPHIMRPGGAYSPTSIQSNVNDTYTYPMNQDEALIWFHDHTLGKTHHNVIAGPAGFFPVKDPSKHGAVSAGACTVAPTPGNLTPCQYTWLDPVTEPRNFLTVPMYDLFFALQDRAFSDDGSINFSNGQGQGLSTTTIGADPNGVVNGANPDVHPVWIPEYFGDHPIVNGVIWPKKTVDAGWYRIRFANGSDSRCWTLGFTTTEPVPGVRPVNNVRFTVIASDQGYLSVPKQNQQTLTFCPGERYEILVDFGKLPGKVAGAPGQVWMTNSANAPYPFGGSPFVAGPDIEMNSIMRYDVTATPGVLSCGAGTLTYNAAVDAPGVAGANGATTWANKGCMKIPTTPDSNIADLRAAPRFVNGTPQMCAPGFVPATGLNSAVPGCVSAIRHLYLNERVDGLTGAPLGMQINGVPFEYKVTETPVEGSVEVWKIINLTVDAHPMHPHLVKHQRVSTQRLNVGAYKRALCGSTTCQPGTSPGNEMQLVPDVDAVVGLTPLYLIGAPTFTLATDFNGGFKDASVALPGQVTTIVARWDGNWTAAPVPTAPGTVAGAACLSSPGSCAAPYTYEPVTTGPYVWHCHINSHEDSEMMRTSLVVP